MKTLASKRSSTTRTRTAGTAASHGRIASVADAKANLTTLLREVEQQHVEITVLRRGTPVAKIAPIETRTPVSGFGWMKDSAQEIGDIVGPSGELWDASDEDVA